MPRKKAAKRKPAGKPAASKDLVKIPQAHGGALLSGGVPGNRGGQLGGRPRDEFKAKLSTLLNRPEQMAFIQTVLDDPSHPHFLRAVEWASDRAFGKEVTPVEGSHELIITVRREGPQ